MKNIILFDDDNWVSLLPLTYTRPVAEIKVGALSIKEKWIFWLGESVSYITQDYLAEKYPIQIKEDNIIINATYLPNDKLVRLIQQLDENEALLNGEDMIAARINRTQFDRLVRDESIQELNGINIEKQKDILNRIERPVDILTNLFSEICQDIKILTQKKVSQKIPDFVQVNEPKNLFIEEGAILAPCSLNCSTGPIYIGKDAEIMEGAMVRGPFIISENSVLKMGAKIYGPTSIGPWCKVGGEVNASCLFGYTNKAHDGFLGNSVLAEWCNLGADTNNSNLKNNYAEVKLWNYQTESFQKTGTQFCGLIMADHAKCGINTMFNTGTVVGVFANIFGSGFPRNFIPSFAWGGHSGFQTYNFRQALDTAELVMDRRSLALNDMDKKILGHIFHSSAKYRAWEP